MQKSKTVEYIKKYNKKFSKGKMSDGTWSKDTKQHTCCGAKNHYLHKVKCLLDSDDLSDLL